MTGHKPMCSETAMCNVTLSMDGRIRYGICKGCGVQMMERLPAPQSEYVAGLAAIQRALAGDGDKSAQQDESECRAG
ncbi:hypothetical protein C2W62_24135 [Candidatus Entotheonella serta]|nr:hypothetical protein C2W62_24135 [Candidatus Entotheonella serta]